MKEIRLVCDLDGVLFDFNSHFVNLARMLYPHCSVPDVSQHYPDEWNYMLKHLHKKEDAELWRRIINSKDFWETCPAYDYADELLVTAQTSADKLYFLTSRSGKRVQAQTVKALNNIAEGLNVTGAVIAVPKAEMKIDIINALNATHFIDDKPETIGQAWTDCVNTKIAIWDQPWNRMYRGKAYKGEEYTIPRISTVKEFDQWLA